MTDSVNPQSSQSGFITNQSRYADRALHGAAGPAETFLRNTRQHPHQAEANASTIEYFTAALGPVIARSGSESQDSDHTVPLPDPVELKIEFGSLLARRKSSRTFSGDPMALDDLSTILHSAAGITHEDAGSAIDRPANYRLRFRGVPSSGGLYAVDCDCLALNVNNLALGAYRYRAFTHDLACVTPARSKDHLLAPFWAEEASGIDYTRLAAAIVLTGNPQKLLRKYGDRGVRYMFLEAGMIAFAANLAATALGWGTLDYQTYYDPEMEQCLALRGGQSYVLHALLLGWPVETRQDGDRGASH